MGNVLKYKGYFSVIQYSVEDRVLYGKIEGITDLINFESDSSSEIENEFHAAVDDYLSYCEQIGKSPDKSYTGNFNVRISPELHRKIALKAIENGMSLNQAVENAIDKDVNTPDMYMCPPVHWSDHSSLADTKGILPQGAVIQTFNCTENNTRFVTSWFPR